MRILRVRFKNLNSLVGEWQIDLMHPAFASDGIFAITGPNSFLGAPEAVEAAAMAVTSRALELIDMRKHKGSHPRVGAVDVVPFIPIRNMTMTEAVEIARRSRGTPRIANRLLRRVRDGLLHLHATPGRPPRIGEPQERRRDDGRRQHHDDRRAEHGLADDGVRQAVARHDHVPGFVEVHF